MSIPLREIFGKGQLRKIHDAHQDAARKAKRNSDMEGFHVKQAERAKRLAMLRDKKIPDRHVDLNKQYNKQDRARAYELKNRAEGKK